MCRVSDIRVDLDAHVVVAARACVVGPVVEADHLDDLLRVHDEVRAHSVGWVVVPSLEGVDHAADAVVAGVAPLVIHRAGRQRGEALAISRVRYGVDVLEVRPVRGGHPGHEWTGCFEAVRGAGPGVDRRGDRGQLDQGGLVLGGETARPRELRLGCVHVPQVDAVDVLALLPEAEHLLAVDRVLTQDAGCGVRSSAVARRKGAENDALPSDARGRRVEVSEVVAADFGEATSPEPVA